ncbi:hypothetical protein [Streptomyces sp. NPDC002133]|uniref:hypothetical protein n=1 Tax=Streptomyces sp. NPDC002133 TaxID=3154409 RepID=UPI003332D985
MKLTIAGLRTFLPGLPDDATTFRNALDESGLEVKSIDADGPRTTVTLEFLANRGDQAPAVPGPSSRAARFRSTITM